MRKINVLQFVCPSGFYGAERWILTLINNLDPELVRSSLAVTKEPGQRLEIVNHFSSDEGEVFEIETKSRLDLSAISSLCNIIRKNKIDIIHTHGYKSDILGVIAAKKTGIKSISTPHGFGEHHDFKLRLYIAIGKRCLRYFDRIVPLSQQLVDQVAVSGTSRDKIRFIRNAVDLKEVAMYRKEKNIGSKVQDKTIGYIGQIIDRKNVDHIIDVFDSMWHESKSIQLKIVGDGNERENVQSYAESLPSAGNIDFTGFRNDRLDLLGELDLFVMTSSREGIPRCLMEAMSMGVPVVAYDIPGVDQLIKHGETGLLAAYGDKEMLKECWQQLLDDEEYASSLAVRGQKYINEVYSGQRMADEYTELFHDVLQEHA